MNTKRSHGIIGMLVVLFTVFFLWLFVSNLLKADANIKAGIIGFIGVITAALVTHYQTKKRENSARHFANKRESYTGFIDMFFDIMESAQENQNMPQKEIAEKMTSFKKSLMVWGGPEVIRAWNSYELKFAANALKSKEQQPLEETIQDLDVIVRAFRKDLGHNDGTLSKGSLAALILPAEYKIIAFGERWKDELIQAP